jgi:hypothetical protein
MLEYIMNFRDIDILDPYNMLPVEKIIAYLGERR